MKARRRPLAVAAAVIALLAAVAIQSGSAVAARVQGPSTCTVPDLRPYRFPDGVIGGKFSIPTARQQIVAAGLVPYVVNPSGGNFVIGQSPAALLGVLCGSTVRITVGTGCFVPFVRGSTVLEAVTRITEAGLNARLLAGGGAYITHQSPAGGTEVGCQLRMDIRNESVTYVPDVRGRATASAIDEMQRQLLNPHSHPAASVAGGPSTQHVGKWVVGQSPAPGTAVAPFTHIHLYLSGRGEIP